LVGIPADANEVQQDTASERITQDMVNNDLQKPGYYDDAEAVTVQKQ